ncbi:MAG: peptidoglycan DD-metalloendopeptidase family protein [Acidimicrobiia bacterium]
MPARRRVPFRALALVASIAQLVLAPTPSGAAPPCLLPPVAAPVVDRFREPPCPYCAGNRGLELAPAAGSAVVAAAPGRVSFSGSVAGVRYVVVEHQSGHRTTYGRLAGILVRTGALVAAGTPVGTSSDRLFFGLRHGEQYLDPAPHLATVRARPQLVPLDGRNRLPARPGAVTCPAGGGGGGAFR